MRIANLDGRLVVVTNEGAIDVENASDGRFDSDPQSVYSDWDEFSAWASSLDGAAAKPFDRARLRAPVPRPGQIFAIGLNYSDHAKESGMDLPPEPAVFTKFQASITGPYDDVTLPTDTVDWEVELVLVIGREAYQVAKDNAWDHIAGVTVGQDLSERTRQLVQPVPQFSIGKSFPGFAPIGPTLVTVDELSDPDDLELGCSINGETVQKGRTSDLIFTVPDLIERLSAILPLQPGDLIFTGTPRGVGHARTPQRYLAAGDTLDTWIEDVGEMSNSFVAGPRHITRSN
jgi:2-keto-4-pentenoate hydratase/2-oxohepta-3-ene-1,7-dioic acid hydratase in catechol pathway